MLGKHQGFTLIEILLSLMIFALLGLGTYSVLNSTIQGKEIVIEQNQKLSAIQRAMMIIETDIVQFAQRKARIEGEKPSEQFFLMGESVFDSESVGFGFVRDGWVNPGMLLPRSELQRVAYRVIEQDLQRLYFNYVDNDLGAEPRIQTLLSGVDSISITLLAPNNKKMDDNTLPRALEFTIETQAYGSITRVFSIPAITENEQQATNE